MLCHTHFVTLQAIQHIIEQLNNWFYVVSAQTGESGYVMCVFTLWDRAPVHCTWLLIITAIYKELYIESTITVAGSHSTARSDVCTLTTNNNSADL
jgi:hypothetical protein